MSGEPRGWTSEITQSSARSTLVPSYRPCSPSTWSFKHTKDQPAPNLYITPSFPSPNPCEPPSHSPPPNLCHSPIPIPGKLRSPPSLRPGVPRIPHRPFGKKHRHILVHEIGTNDSCGFRCRIYHHYH
ncbi:hypothetical protein DACRYDRAFT_88490 [Dacryopinax primogenitus]|uniref:Uncharacterized protein n=1 Tax=Dacryopinax primogenitus (strain DJM 731) TaxID=1858805 RepID=M5G3J6_DACPD|nr:uncharacterized protein DACRYDRAFT_88490 [Dacryopinax primogenitus]EJU02795.1 hypothetical protein DACRYDRAFT_88490 [Dacryopinax primogenitus]